MRLLRHLALVVCLLTAIATTSLGCHAPPIERPPPCATQDLVTIEAAYVAEVVEACKGYTLRTCPSIQPIERRYADKREAWIRCRR